MQAEMRREARCDAGRKPRCKPRRDVKPTAGKTGCEGEEIADSRAARVAREAERVADHRAKECTCQGPRDDSDFETQIKNPSRERPEAETRDEAQSRDAGREASRQMQAER